MGAMPVRFSPLALWESIAPLSSKAMGNVYADQFGLSSKCSRHAALWWVGLRRIGKLARYHQRADTVCGLHHPQVLARDAAS